MVHMIGRVLGWLLVATCALLLVSPHLLPHTSGHRFLIVDGGSMAPTMLPGDVLLAQPPTGDDLHLGAVVVVGTPQTSYTHRVIELDDDAGTLRARLQGDANAVADPHWVRQPDVIAIPTHIFSGGAAWLLRAVLQPPGSLMIAGLLILGLVWLLMPSRTGRFDPDIEQQNCSAKE